MEPMLIMCTAYEFPGSAQHYTSPNLNFLSVHCSVKELEGPRMT